MSALGSSPVRSARRVESIARLRNRQRAGPGIGFNGLTRSDGQSRALAAEHDRARLFRLRDSRAGVCRKL